MASLVGTSKRASICIYFSKSVLLRAHGGNFQVIYSRHRFTADALVFWFLQSFHPLFHDFPWALAVRIALEKCLLEEGTTQSRILCVLMWISVTASICSKKMILDKDESCVYI